VESALRIFRWGDTGEVHVLPNGEGKAFGSSLGEDEKERGMQAVALVPSAARRAAVFLAASGDVAADLKTRSAVVSATRTAGLEVTMLIEKKESLKASLSELVLAATNGAVDVVVVKGLVDLGCSYVDAVSTALNLF